MSVELQKKNELFMVAHELTEEYPDRAVSWFAVACYYYCVRRFDAARRYFSKATSLDGAFVPAWIGFGHAFAAQDESDQAMAAYRTAARLFPGCHLPALCIGMEYRRTNNLEARGTVLRRGAGRLPGGPARAQRTRRAGVPQPRPRGGGETLREAVCRSCPTR